MTARRGFGFAVLALACAGLAWTSPPAQGQGSPKAHAPQAVTVLAEEILFDRDHPNETRFGKLEWLGTLRLTSTLDEFGGYSGLAVDRTGARLLAVSDTGTWLAADIVTRRGRLEKLTGARIGAITGLGGKPLKGKFNRDSEGLALATPGSLTGDAYVSFERNHRIALHRVAEDGIGPARRLLPLPARAKSADGNKGLEGIAVLRGGPSKGALIAFTEEYLDAAGNHIGWLIAGPKPGMVTLKRRGGFAVTDLAGLANGGLVVLERRFRFSEGVKMRLRRIGAAEIKPGALLDGEVLLQADALKEIDNMEGLAVHEDEAGRTIVTLISDDNFHRTLQRTLLMRFAIVE